MYPTLEEAEKRLKMIDIQYSSIKKEIEAAENHLKGLDIEYNFLTYLISKQKVVNDGNR